MLCQQKIFDDVSRTSEDLLSAKQAEAEAGETSHFHFGDVRPFGDSLPLKMFEAASVLSVYLTKHYILCSSLW
jgi:hypothetical protein